LKILITDADTRAALAATRSLAALGEVVVAGPAARSLAGWSRFASDRVVIPDSLERTECFLNGVLRCVQEHHIDVVVPVTDAACEVLIPVRDALAPAMLAAPSESAYRGASDKSHVARLAKLHGLCIPEGCEVENFSQALVAATELGWPVVLKPTFSVKRTPEGRGIKLAVVRAGDTRALEEAWCTQGVERALVQHAVPGVGEGLFILRWGGALRAAFAHRRLREKPPEGGVSVLSESIPLEEGRLRAVEALLAELDFEGVAMAEFKVGEEGAWLMEVNARLWGSLQLAVDAGVDFPRLFVECLCGRPPAAPTPYRNGLRLRWFLGDLDHALALARGARAADGSSGLGAALRVLLRPTGSTTRFELLRRDDPWPCVLALARWLSGRSV